nr:phosphoglyceromutase [Raoultella sp. NCTC 9187]
MSVSKKPMVLVILDGYGYREEQQDNAIYSAKTPVMDALWAKRPHLLIDASGLEVGLPDRQMGNSEVGHVNLGAGRIVYQDLTRLDVEIKERTFFANPVLTAAVDKATAAGKAVHIMGLMSPGGVHSHEDHIMAMVELAAERGAEKIYLHAFPRRPRYSAAQCGKNAGEVRRQICRPRQRPRGLYYRSLLRNGPRQPLGSRRAGV